MEKKDKYSKLLQEGGLFFYGTTKGSFILPPAGYALWKNIQSVLDKKFMARGVQNVLLPTLIPLDLLEKEKKHIAGFSPECFYIERIGEKKIENPLILRPTSEVLFYDWYRQILQSYQQLPLLYNQWCSVFRAEKNTSPFFRNTEFLWQEGHTLHSSEKEAREFALNILSDYQDYAENILCLGVIVGRKTEGERFAGALETYTIECLLPDGQCLQFATSHYFGNNFCRLMDIKFHNKDNQIQHPFSTSWGTSTRAIGAVAKSHKDKWGLILPFEITPIQIAFICTNKSQELLTYYQKIRDLLVPRYRCRLYDSHEQVSSNFFQADKEGCPVKIVLWEDKKSRKKEITFIRRDNIEGIRISINLEENEIDKKKDEIIKIINKEAEEFKKVLYQKSVEFRDEHIFLIDNYPELEKKIKEGVIGLFLVSFCNKLDCEKGIKEKVPVYSIRCIKELSISEKKKTLDSKKCLFCELPAENMVYLGRSY